MVDGHIWFVSSPGNRLNEGVVEVMADVSNRRGVPPSEKNKLIIQELYKKGLFNVRGTIDLAAKEIGVSRYTVYNYIREAKVKIGEA